MIERGRPDNFRAWVECVRGGDTRALARAITTVENRKPEAVPLLKALFPYSGRAQVIGVTGAPGAGKSTLVDQLAHEFRKQQQTVGIIAVDPTSPYSGGAILGDRIRMQSHTGDSGIYIRSMATRGALGGLSRATSDVAMTLDASGRDVVLIETVGTGQDEIDIVRLADVTIVVLVPGMGDEVQTIKAGIMEIADIFVINKADRPGAERLEHEVRAVQMMASRKDNWMPPVIPTVAPDGKGIAELAAAITSYQEFLANGNLMAEKKLDNWRQRLIEMLRDAVLQRVVDEKLANGAIAAYAAEVAQHKRDPYSLVEQLVGSSGNSETLSAEPKARSLGGIIQPY